MDQEKIRTVHRTAVLSCAMMTGVPFLMSWVAFLMYEPGAGSFDPMLLAIYGLLALTPLVAVPLYRPLARRAIIQQMKSPEGPAVALMTWSVAEYAIWELSSLIGFVGFAATSQVWFMAACVAFTLIGYAYSFPRWSKWEWVLSDTSLLQEASVPAPL